jgi:hypothetical protein
MKISDINGCAAKMGFKTTCETLALKYLENSDASVSTRSHSGSGWRPSTGTFQEDNSSMTNSAVQKVRTGTVLVPKPLETKAVVCS